MEEEIMPLVRFWGSEDDVIEVQSANGSVKGTDQFPIKELSQSGGWHVGTFILEDVKSREGMKVYAFYDNETCWSFSIAQAAENVPIPDWTTRVYTDKRVNRYSAILAVEVPDGCRVYALKSKPDKETREIVNEFLGYTGKGVPEPKEKQ
jgi:hypothetical protein